MITPFLKTLPLDNVRNAVAAYSFRKLKATAIKAIRVQRSSDNAELDIGFIGTRLDIVSMMSFVGANTGYITTWYDQSGSGNDATQSDNTKMPRIINAGTMDVDSNGNPIAYFDGSNDWLNCGFAGVNNPDTLTINAVALDRNVGVAEHQIVSCTEAGGFALIITNGTAPSDKPIFTVHYNTVYNNITSTAITSNTHLIFTGTFNKDTKQKLFKNNTKVGELNTGHAITAPPAATVMAIAANPNNSGGVSTTFPLSISEVIRFNRELSEIEAQKLNKNQSDYYKIY